MTGSALFKHNYGLSSSCMCMDIYRLCNYDTDFMDFQ